ncbi:MAG: DinB family protein [Anaerolineaceae bacterium]|nr:DinB family protein [Anaerolineaceae bacterium]
MATFEQVRKSYVHMMRLTCDTLEHLFQNASQEDITTYRDQNDGDKGWTALEVLCHLRDFDTIFYLRAVMIVEQDYPRLPAYDHEAIAIERKYNEQDLRQVCEEFRASRERTRAFFKSLTPEQWERAGIHPESGHFTLTNAVMQVVSHDVNHLEQITRILMQRSQSYVNSAG